MREQREPFLEQPFPRKLRDLPPPSPSGLGRTSSGDADELLVLPRVHVGPVNKIRALVVVAPLLAVVFLVSNCRFWNGRAAVASSVRRRLAAGKDRGEQQDGTTQRTCEELVETLGQQHEGAFAGTPAPPTEEPGTAESDSDITEPRKKTRKTKIREDVADTPAGQGTIARSGDCESRPPGPVKGLLREQRTPATLYVPYIELQSRGGVGKSVHGATSHVADLEQSTTTTTRTGVLAEAPKDSDSRDEGTSRPAQQENRELLFGAAGALWNEQNTSSLLPEDPPCTSSAAIVANEPHRAGTAVYGLLTPPVSATHSTSGLVARAGTSTGQAPSPRSLDYSVHLFYRLPEVPPLSNVVPLRLEALNKGGYSRNLVDLLLPIRELLVKKRLTFGEVKSLILHAEGLLNHVTNDVAEEPPPRWDSEIVESLARRFLIADTLWCVCELVGEAMLKELWWQRVVGSFLQAHESHPSRRKPITGRQAKNISLAQRLAAALEQYGQGVRPVTADVVKLKHEIFFDQRAPFTFSRPAWDAWRHDHMVSVESAVRSGEISLHSTLLHESPAVLQEHVEALPSTSGVCIGVGASMGQTPATEDELYSRHAFYRLPRAQGVAALVPVDRVVTREVNATTTLVSVLCPVRELLLKANLTQDEAQLLVGHGEQMLQYGVWRLVAGYGGRMPDVLRSLARRFWFADMLWCTCEVLGPAMKKDVWWESTMGFILAPSAHAQLPVPHSVLATEHTRLANRLIAALEVYRQGMRPRAAEVVQLKRTILNCTSIMWDFQGPDWDPFRRDDQIWEGSS